MDLRSLKAPGVVGAVLREVGGSSETLVLVCDAAACGFRQLLFDPDSASTHRQPRLGPALALLGEDGAPFALDGFLSCATSWGGQVFFAEGHSVRCLDSSNVVRPVAGSVREAGACDGESLVARFTCPSALAVLPGGRSLLVSDAHGLRLVRLEPFAVSVTTIFAHGDQVMAGTSGRVLLASASCIYDAVDIAAGGSGGLELLPYAGAEEHGGSGSVDAACGSSARFRSITGLAIDGCGHAVVLDAQADGSVRVRVVTADSAAAGTACIISGCDEIGGSPRRTASWRSYNDGRSSGSGGVDSMAAVCGNSPYSPGREMQGYHDSASFSLDSSSADRNDYDKDGVSLYDGAARIPAARDGSGVPLFATGSSCCLRCPLVLPGGTLLLCCPQEGELLLVGGLGLQAPSETQAQTPIWQAPNAGSMGMPSQATPCSSAAPRPHLRLCDRNPVAATLSAGLSCDSPAVSGLHESVTAVANLHGHGRFTHAAGTASECGSCHAHSSGCMGDAAGMQAPVGWLGSKGQGRGTDSGDSGLKGLALLAVDGIECVGNGRRAQRRTHSTLLEEGDAGSCCSSPVAKRPCVQ